MTSTHPLSPPTPEGASAAVILGAAGITLRRLGENPLDVLPRLDPDRPDEGLPLTAEERQRVFALERSRFAQRELDRARAAGAAILTPLSPEYPRLLLEIPDPPLAIWVVGSPEWLARPAIGVVGSRNASVYGRSMAESLASQLAMRGLTIVSGFARGIDASAHSAALKAGGATVAVLGCGIDIDYPKGHDRLRESVIRRGCLATEFPLGRRPDRSTFPRRNRIISGLSLGVVVVEAADRSGALVTARHALEQNREVFAVPGSAFSPGSRGPHRLLRDGAKLTESVEDILEEIGSVLPATPAPRPEPPEGSLEARICSALGAEPVHIDELSRRLDIPMASLMSALSMLELKRCVRQHPGKSFSRT